jgi:hypothetical protein
VKEEGIGKNVDKLIEILKKYGFQENPGLKGEYQLENTKITERAFIHDSKYGILSLLHDDNEIAIYWYDKEEAISILQDFAKDLEREIEIIENPFLVCLS